MDLSRVLRQPIIVEHVTQDGPPDEMGDPTEVLTYTRYLGWVWQTSVSEQTANGVVAVEDWRMALERTASGTVATGDRVIPNGLLDDGVLVPGSGGEPFDVDGPPWDALNPRTQLVEFVQAKLVRSQ